MADLIEKFFKKDLTEAEKEALGKQLSSSDKAAKKFGEKAEEVYRSFGLPEARWTGPDVLRPYPRSSGWKWIALGLVLILLGGGGAWVLHWWNSPEIIEEAKQFPTVKPTEGVSSQAHPLRKKKVSVSNQPLTASFPVSNAGSSGVSQKSPAPALIAPLPKVTPVNLDNNPNGAFSSLSVQLHLASSRSVTVKVLDGKGEELQPLFNGPLPSGTWAFEWNGLLKDGTLAQPGTYKIEVRSGSWAQTKEVLIQK